MLLRGLASLVIVLALAIPQLARTAAAAPALSHVYVIIEENTSNEEIVGNTEDAPYINSLINTYGYAANYYGVTHPREPIYIAPDQCHDMHGVSPPSATSYGIPGCGYPPNWVVSDPTVQMADAYLKTLVTTIMSSAAWTSDSAIVVAWDEDESSGIPTTGPT